VLARVGFEPTTLQTKGV